MSDIKGPGWMIMTPGPLPRRRWLLPHLSRPVWPDPSPRPQQTASSLELQAPPQPAGIPGPPVQCLQRQSGRRILGAFLTINCISTMYKGFITSLLACFVYSAHLTLNPLLDMTRAIMSCVTWVAILKMPPQFVISKGCDRCCWVKRCYQDPGRWRQCKDFAIIAIYI